MVNIDKFSKKLKKVIEYYELSASSFADKVGVQRSSISHLLSGRNKPSLDFVLKVIDEFPEVNWNWLLLDKGTFPASKNEITPNLFSKTTPIKNQISKIDDHKSESSEHPISETEIPKNDIEQIVIFYKNGTFKNYYS